MIQHSAYLTGIAPSRAAGTFEPITAGGIVSGNGTLYLPTAGENG
jgi:hypothetical protein